MKRILLNVVCTAVASLVPVAAFAQTSSPAPVSRRPSMVGYIEDSTIGTGFRLRFDASQGIHDPDRAEFFYAKCGCYWGLPTNSPLYDPNTPGDRDGLAVDINNNQLYIQGEYAVMNNRASLFAELPVRWLKPQAVALGALNNESGISDLRVGGKAQIMSRDNGQATGMLRVTIPTGDASKGLGTDHASIEPALIVSHDFDDRFGAEAEFGAVIAVGGSAGIPTAGSDKFSGSVLYYGIGPSYDVYQSSTLRISPVVELVGWRVLGGFQTGNPNVASGPDTGFAKATDVAANIVNIKAGVRATFGNMASIYVGYGKHLTNAMWYDDIFRVEYRLGLGK
jgi:hypothetical protein